MAVPERTEPPWGPKDPWFVYLGEREALLRADAAAVARYGEDHPEVWGGAWIDDDARLQVGLTVLSPHTVALAALLEHPGEVDIVAVPRTTAELTAVLDDVRRVFAEHRALFTRFGISNRRVDVHLRPAAEALARELHDRHGDAVRLIVGALPYPPDPKSPPKPIPGPVITTTWTELTLSAHPDTVTVRAGDIITGTVTITNTGKRAVHLRGGQPLPAQLLDLDGQVAGHYTGPIAGTGISGHLEPGQSCRVRFLGDTAGTATYLTPPAATSSSCSSTSLTPSAPSTAGGCSPRRSASTSNPCELARAAARRRHRCRWSRRPAAPGDARQPRPRPTRVAAAHDRKRLQSRSPLLPSSCMDRGLRICRHEPTLGARLPTVTDLTQDESCTLCQLLRGDLPATRVHEDDDVVAIMDHQPVTAGHILVVTRQHTALLDDLNEDLGAHVYRVAHRLSRALRRSGLRCEGVNLFLADGAAAFQEIPHVHMHVFPRYTGDSFKIDADWHIRPRHELEDAAALVRKALKLV